MPTQTYLKPRKRSRLYKYKRSSKLDKRIYKIAQMASARVSKREINKQFEKHYHDHSASTSVSYSGSAIDISQVTVGDTDSTRSGDRLTIKSIHVRGNCYVADTGGNLIRVMLIQCLRTDSSTIPQVSNEILQSTVAGTVFAPFGSYAKDFAGYTWVPLYDTTLAVSDTGMNLQQFEIKIKPKDFKRKAKPYIQYEGGAVTGVGKIYLVLYSDSSAVTHPILNHWSRIRFIDN